jgi:hypothetical protein
LAQLLALSEEQDGDFSAIWPEIRALNSYGVEVRYPGSFTTLDEAQGAIFAVEQVRYFIRVKLGLDVTIDTE